METAITGLVAICGLVLSGLVVLIERGRDKKAAADALVGRAAGFNAWTALVEKSDDARARYGVQVHNSLSTPVYDVLIESTTATGEVFPKTLRLDTVPPGDYFFESSFDRGGTWSFGEPSLGVAGLHPVMRKPRWRVVSLAFRDAYGEWWERTPQGLVSCDSERVAIDRQARAVQDVNTKMTVVVRR